MKKDIPLKEDNPRGLHAKYLIKKFSHMEKVGEGFFGSKYKAVFKDVDPESEYFVLRLDEKQKDPNHLRACRIGIHAYADAIEATIPQLAKDLRERYPLI